MHTPRAESRKTEGDSARRVKNAMLMMHSKFVINAQGKLFLIDSVANDCQAGADSHRLPPFYGNRSSDRTIWPAQDFPSWSYLYGHIINHLLTELTIFQPRQQECWPCLVLFCVLIDRDGVEVHKLPPPPPKKKKAWPIDLCHAAAILSQEIQKALFMHGQPRSLYEASRT